MNVSAIRIKARELGVKNSNQMKKADLIYAIQRTEGNTPCFLQIEECGQRDCCWFEDCQNRP